MQFRQQALSKLQSPEEIDLPVRFARPQGWLVLTVTVLFVIAASVWAVTGTVSSTLGAPGILTHGQGSYILQSPVSGQVTAVLAQEGKRVAANTPVLKVRTARGTTVVRTLAAGRLTTMVATIGSVVTTGADVASVERVAHARDPLTATLYVPAQSGASVPVGALVDLTVQSVPSQQYGVLRGRVKAVGRTAQTRQRIGAYLGNSQLGEEFSQHGQPLAVLVQLDAAPHNASGYAWSASGGPPYALDSMTPVTGAVHLAAQHPIDWLLP
ncbi:HlyD family secretion protein [Streptomyces sp. 2224.1]|uniref:HlyD family efflux transporter periplasmic adaptor subunit n=1 Tax=unclassified Streptomyces TaxID=2593676 RepID=UPI000888BF8A|nr:MULTISPECIES: HlyD family efflux transporter periplasmic adaptor subunit [unclassified Streptomyces]PBC80798.1 HlyD family secretion protein [Streptomyces sp. 2321.6]SDR57267.1 HlyD family secretion protein [Streptomyces sp. KS_16]SEB88967.1 HlyD family secretion protein [Streptomyces sp. 2133.1]SED36913.1 HlyD family secretion protein [Streptomyces sp. 2224.1]SEF12668.1 HlyD family secretion protein [Streptomyces sp. 2112.3]